jgi:HAD superfamily phosphatase (TIGR01681 family)
MASLRSPDSAWCSNKGINVLIARACDLGRVTTSAVPAAELVAAVHRSCALRRGGVTIVILPPHGADAQPAMPGSGGDGLLAQALSECPGVVVVDEAAVGAAFADLGGRERVLSDFMGRVAHAPYTAAAASALGLLATRQLARALAPRRKVVCLDCDNTLWGGAVGERGAAGVELSAPFLALQRFFVALQRRGLLLCLVSRNHEGDVRAVLTRRAAELVLRAEHVVAVAANWEAKSANLRRLAADLCLDLGSFVFVDDSPLECAEVRAGCAESGLAVVQLPREPELYPRFLEHCWAFDPPPADDGKARTHGTSGTAVQWPACSALCSCLCATRCARRPGLRPALASADLH